MILGYLGNLLCLLVYGYTLFTFGRMWEARTQAEFALRLSLLPSIKEEEAPEPEPITARNPNAALAALAMRWDQESWAPPGPEDLSPGEERSYHHAEVER